VVQQKQKQQQQQQQHIHMVMHRCGVALLSVALQDTYTWSDVKSYLDMFGLYAALRI
jgi:hypothetical protein